MAAIFRQGRQLCPIATHTKRLFSTKFTQSPLPSGGYVSHLEYISDKKLFILDPRSISNLTGELEKAANETDLRALFLRSTIAGADIKYMKEIENPDAAEDFIRSIDKLCSTIEEFPVPVIAIIDGPCLGAGMEVAASCDIRIAVRGEKTVFGMPETKVGIPSVVQASLLPGLIGWGRAREVLYLGNAFNAETGLEWGFVNEIVAEKSLGKRLRRWEHKINDTGPKAVRLQKELMREWEKVGTGRDGIEASVRIFARAFETDEPKTMMGSFFAEKARRKNASS